MIKRATSLTCAWKDMYEGILNHSQNEVVKTNADKIGNIVNLSSSFTGSSYTIREKYQNAMTNFAQFGRSDIFITFTCTTEWNEITKNLEEWQCVKYRPDLVIRVFCLKLAELIKEIKKKYILAVPIAHCTCYHVSETGSSLCANVDYPKQYVDYPTNICCPNTQALIA